MLRWVILFATFSVIYVAGVVVWWMLKSDRKRQQVVRNLASKIDPEATVSTTVLIPQPGRSGGLGSVFRTVNAGNRINRLGKGTFFLLTLATALGGFWIGLNFTGMFGILAPVIGAFVLGSVPRLYKVQLKDKRLAAIEEQFPEALDFLARSVRAGNAFSIALELLAAETSEPLKSEVSKITREMALGAGLDDALQGLINRVPLLEIRMFVAAVLLQRETGGNLSEVLSKLGNSVRERLRLRGQVKAASGQGRFTAKVLTFLPVGTLLMLKLVSPAYLDNLINDPVGRNLLGAAAVSQIIGYIVMQKMIKVEV